MNSRPRSLIQWGQRLIYLLVLVGLIYTVWQGVDRISASQISLSRFRWAWLPAAVLFYFASMVICWIYWHMVLIGLGQRPQRWNSFRAFVMGQLGKYFPGKALVVLLRTSLIAGPGVEPAVAATSVFLETLTFMAVGAGLASLIMLGFVEASIGLKLIGIGGVLAAGLPIVPPVFRWLIFSLRIDRVSPKIGAAVARLDFGLAIRGWLILPVSWILVGLSLWATIRLIGVVDIPWTEVPRLTACASLAIVAGFLSFMPGGLGVREFVLIGILTPLDPAFNTTITMVVAVILRLVWLMTEALATIILKGLAWFPRNSVPPHDPTLDDAPTHPSPTARTE